MSRKSRSLSDLYNDRKGNYAKPKAEEDFLKQLNETLAVKEKELYTNCKINHPFIFIFGLPRSGTTLISQLIAHCMDVGFINNFMARFYLAPVHGIRLSRLIFGNEKKSSFQSDYARTSDLTDIHEFGYFWRYWLKKEMFTGITQAVQIEKEIDWTGLKHTLANMQNEFGKPMVFKNIFGSYHLIKMNKVIEKIIYIYIKRDILDSAISILDARRKYNSNMSTWWSSMPIEYEQLKDLDYWHQIAGQVFFLQRYYENISKKLNNLITINYYDLTMRPRSVLEHISIISEKLYKQPIDLTNLPIEKFAYRSYEERNEDKEKFKLLIEDYYNKYS
jgi:hypothetical protein